VTLAAATSAFAQTTTAPSGTDCSSASAASSQTCQNQLQQPGMINNNTQTPIPQTNSPAVGPQGGSGTGTGGGMSGGSVGGSGTSPNSSSGGLGGSSGGGSSSGGGGGL
jgi:hypothetical protein